MASFGLENPPVFYKQDHEELRTEGESSFIKVKAGG
jgi:hypothetical protein